MQKEASFFKAAVCKVEYVLWFYNQNYNIFLQSEEITMLNVSLGHEFEAENYVWLFQSSSV